MNMSYQLMQMRKEREADADRKRRESAYFTGNDHLYGEAADAARERDRLKQLAQQALALQKLKNEGAYGERRLANKGALDVTKLKEQGESERAVFKGADRFGAVAVEYVDPKTLETAERLVTYNKETGEIVGPGGGGTGGGEFDPNNARSLGTYNGGNEAPADKRTRAAALMRGAQPDRGEGVVQAEGGPLLYVNGRDIYEQPGRTSAPTKTARLAPRPEPGRKPEIPEPVPSHIMAAIKNPPTPMPASATDRVNAATAGAMERAGINQPKREGRSYMDAGPFRLDYTELRQALDLAKRSAGYAKKGARYLGELPGRTGLGRDLRDAWEGIKYSYRNTVGLD